MSEDPTIYIAGPLPTPASVRDALRVIVAHLEQDGYGDAIVSCTGMVAFRTTQTMALWGRQMDQILTQDAKIRAVQQIAREAADVANFCMMLVDVLGGLPESGGAV